ncbi:MAG: lipoyl synthase [bacterium]
MNRHKDKKNESLHLPVWLRKKQKLTPEILKLKRMLRSRNLCTVCESAGCPNIVECFKKPTATFLILGNHCTRNCAYCGIPKGKPDKLDPEEPLRVAKAVKGLKLKHVVITSVTRDDLPDGGAEHFAQTVKAVKKELPESTVEVLIPDFRGSKENLKIVLDSAIDVLNHNVETVPQLYAEVRPQADYQRSLELLKRAKKITPRVIVKSGLMVGLGETDAQLIEVFNELSEIDCDALTIGQYLRPSTTAYPVQEYIKPENFEKYKEQAEKAGIKWVFSAPLVRSSYNAESLMNKCKRIKNQKERITFE